VQKSGCEYPTASQCYVIHHFICSLFYYGGKGLCLGETVVYNKPFVYSLGDALISVFNFWNNTSDINGNGKIKTSPSAILSTKNYEWTNRILRSKTPANKNLSHGTA
jgi:hypothetical protein